MSPIGNQQYNVQAGQSLWGDCHRCGAPKAPMMIGLGQMVLCTKCTSAEDQQAQLEFIEMAKRLGVHNSP